MPENILVARKDRPVTDFIHEPDNPVFFEKSIESTSEGKLEKNLSSSYLALPSPRHADFDNRPGKGKKWIGFLNRGNFHDG